MDKKLFTEEFLARGIPDEIMARINRIAPTPDLAIFEKIAESEEAERYARSFSVPSVTAHNSTSVLLQDVKKKNTFTPEKSTRGNRRGGQSN